MRLRLITVPIVLLFLAPLSLAADRADFSGSYTMTKSTGDFKLKKGEVWTLNVTQSDTLIEVTEVNDGKSTTNKYPLDGKEGPYVSPGGMKGACKGQFKKSALVLESVVDTRPQPNSPSVRLDTKERWELSGDMRTLTIHVDINIPNAPIQLVNPWSEIFTRN